MILQRAPLNYFRSDDSLLIVRGQCSGMYISPEAAYSPAHDSQRHDEIFQQSRFDSDLTFHECCCAAPIAGDRNSNSPTGNQPVVYLEQFPLIYDADVAEGDSSNYMAGRLTVVRPRKKLQSELPC